MILFYKTLLLLSAICLPFSAALYAQKPQPYRILNGEGKEVGFEKLLQIAADADVVLFGELHDNPICHWLQKELTSSLYEKWQQNMVLGAEMLESDQQLVLDEYLNNYISEKNFTDALKLWPNYATDYKPLVDFAKQKQLPFVATNVPRRYASMLFKNGIESLDKLTETAKQYVAPLPFAFDPTLPGYKAMLEMGGHSGTSNENMPKAQALKDATMAHFILKNLAAGKHFLHYNGSYHSNNKEGIVWYLLQKKPALQIITIASVEQENTDKLETETLKIGDFVLLVNANMTKTH